MSEWNIIPSSGALAGMARQANYSLEEKEPSLIGSSDFFRQVSDRLSYHFLNPLSWVSQSCLFAVGTTLSLQLHRLIIQSFRIRALPFIGLSRLLTDNGLTGLLTTSLRPEEGSWQKKFSYEVSEGIITQGIIYAGSLLLGSRVITQGVLLCLAGIIAEEVSTQFLGSTKLTINFREMSPSQIASALVLRAFDTSAVMIKGGFLTRVANREFNREPQEALNRVPVLCSFVFPGRAIRHKAPRAQGILSPSQLSFRRAVHLAGQNSSLKNELLKELAAASEGVSDRKRIILVSDEVQRIGAQKKQGVKLTVLSKEQSFNSNYEGLIFVEPVDPLANRLSWKIRESRGTVGDVAASILAAKGWWGDVRQNLCQRLEERRGDQIATDKSLKDVAALSLRAGGRTDVYLTYARTDEGRWVAVSLDATPPSSKDKCYIHLQSPDGNLWHAANSAGQGVADDLTTLTRVGILMPASESIIPKIEGMTVEHLAANGGIPFLREIIKAEIARSGISSARLNGRTGHRVVVFLPHGSLVYNPTTRGDIVKTMFTVKIDNPSDRLFGRKEDLPDSSQVVLHYFGEGDRPEVVSSQGPEAIRFIWPFIVKNCVWDVSGLSHRQRELQYHFARPLSILKTDATLPHQLEIAIKEVTIGTTPVDKYKSAVLIGLPRRIEPARKDENDFILHNGLLVLNPGDLRSAQLLENLIEQGSSGIYVYSKLKGPKAQSLTWHVGPTFGLDVDSLFQVLNDTRCLTPLVRREVDSSQIQELTSAIPNIYFLDTINNRVRKVVERITRYASSPLLAEDVANLIAIVHRTKTWSDLDRLKRVLGKVEETLTLHERLFPLWP